MLQKMERKEIAERMQIEVDSVTAFSNKKTLVNVKAATCRTAKKVADMQKTILSRETKIFGLVLLLVCSALLCLKSWSVNTKAVSKQSDLVFADIQPESPLKIIITRVDLSNPLKPEVEYLLANTGQKIIRAYTVKHDFTTPHSHFTASDCQVIRSKYSFLQPGQTKSGTISSSGSSEPITKIKLTIDIVEFNDGEYWGPDLTKTRGMIGGMHSGVSVAISFYQQKLATLENLASSLETGVEQDIVSDFPPSEDKSPEWIKGYRAGVASVRARLAKANEDHGTEGIGMELKRAASERNGERR